MHNSISYCFTSRYDLKLCFQIARYASLHGIIHHTNLLHKETRASSTEQYTSCIKSSYQDEFRRIRLGGSNKPLDYLPHKKQRRPVLLGNKIDGMIKAYIKSICEVGESISSQVVIAAARDVFTSLDKTNV